MTLSLAEGTPARGATLSQLSQSSVFGALMLVVNRALHTRFGALVLRGRAAWTIASLTRLSAMVATGGVATDDGFYSRARATAEKLISYLTPTSRVVDLGCGIGRIERFLAPYCAHITGIDPIPGFIRLAIRENAHLPNVEFRVGTGSDLAGISDGSVDFLFAVGVFERLPKATVREYMSEIRRVLSPQSKTYLDFLVVNDDTLASMKRTAWNPSVYTFWTPEEVQQVVKNEGLFLEATMEDGLVMSMVARSAPEGTPSPEVEIGVTATGG